MIISLKKLRFPAVVCALALLTGIGFARLLFIGGTAPFFMGGTMRGAQQGLPDTVQAVLTQSGEVNYARFNRPSAQPALKNPFLLESFPQDANGSYKIPRRFSHPQDVVKTFFGILKDAAYMDGNAGGCGSIGEAMTPYPYAYALFSAQAQKKLSLAQFTDSFKGIGHITLLKVYPLYTPPGASAQRFMYEIEAITGPSANDKNAYGRDGSYFTYYYGVAEVTGDQNSGYALQSVEYIPEDFLCAPFHGWKYDTQYIVQYVYGDWHKIIDRITATEQDGDRIHTYADGKGKKYRFDFVRLTNGYDILLHENDLENGQWKEVNLLKSTDTSFRL